MVASKYIKARFLFSAAFLLLSAHPLASAASPAPKPPAYYTVTFPDAVSVAQLEFKIPVVNAKGGQSILSQRAIARGKIKVPNSAAILIMLTYDGLEHLQPLAQLNPAQVVEFNASGLELDDAQLVFFKRFTAISRLNLNDTMITDKSLPIIGMYKRLQDLRLSKIDITGAGFEALNGLPLLILNLEGTNLKEGNLQKIKSLTQTLIDLNCTKTRIGSEDLAFIATCQKVAHLNLSGNKKITDACVKEIVKLKMLSELNIADTAITERSLPALAKMPNLKELMVRRSMFWKSGSGKSPRSSLTIIDPVAASHTPADVFGPLH